MWTEKTIWLVGHGSGNPSIKKTMYDYLVKRYSGTASKTGVSQATWDGISDELKAALGMTRNSSGTVTWHKGLICVLQPVGLNDTNGKKAHDLYKTCLGRNIYTNSGKRSYVFTPYTDGKYYSDCSSSVSGCHAKAVNPAIGILDTPAMMISSRYEKVEGIVVKNGHITSGIEYLRTGMALMFAGSDWGRLKYSIVGHVEMVYQQASGALLLDSTADSAAATSTTTATASTAAATTSNTVTSTTCNKKVEVVVNTSLNVRKGHTTSSAIVATLKNGDVVTVTQETSDGWGYIGNGWIYLKYTKAYVDPEAETVTYKVTKLDATSETVYTVSGKSTPSTAAVFEATVTLTPASETLTVRSGPGTSYKAVSWSPLANGTKVTVCDAIKAGDKVWYYIKYNGQYGYAWRALLKG